MRSEVLSLSFRCSKKNEIAMPLSATLFLNYHLDL